MKKIIALSLSLILLLSNVGFSVATHYCGGHAVKSALTLGGETVDCGMKEDAGTPHECQRARHTLGVRHCCDNVQQVIHTDNSRPASLITLNFGYSGEMGLTPYLFFSSLSASDCATSSVIPYLPPPLPARNVQVLFQTFLI